MTPTLSRTRERTMIAIMFATWGVVFLDRMSLLYLAPYIARDLRLDDAQIGLLAGVVALSWAVSSVVFGAVSDRVGRKAVLVPMVILFSIISCGCGFAHDFLQLLILRALLGIAEGPCWSVMMALVEENSSPQHRGRNIGIVVSAAAVIGLAIAPVLTTQVAARLGWRASFFIAGVPGLVLGFLIALFVHDSAKSSEERSVHRPRLRDLAHMLRYRNLWACAIGAAGFMTWLFLVNVFGPLYITQVKHEAATTAGFLMGAAGLGSFFIGWIAPALSDRYGRKRILAYSALLSVALPIALLARPLYAELWLLAGILFVTQAGQAISAICIVLVPTESVPKNLSATAIGFTTMFGEIIGGFAAPLAAGAIAERHGLAAPLWIAVVGALLVLAAAVAIRRTAAPGDFSGATAPTS